jgi:hypothetical protein
MRQWLLEDLAPRLCHGYLTVLPSYQFRFSGSIVQPGGGIRSDQDVVCDGRSLVVRDLAAATAEHYPADEALCEAIVNSREIAPPIEGAPTTPSEIGGGPAGLPPSPLQASADL